MNFYLITTKDRRQFARVLISRFRREKSHYTKRRLSPGEDKVSKVQIPRNSVTKTSHSLVSISKLRVTVDDKADPHLVGVSFPLTIYHRALMTPQPKAELRTRSYLSDFFCNFNLSG